MNDFSIVLLTLLGVQMLGLTIFTPFAVDMPIWRKLLKWSLVNGVTIGLFFVVGVWSAALPLAMVAVGSIVHFTVCRKWGIHPIYATPRREFYQHMGWTWRD